MKQTLWPILLCAVLSPGCLVSRCARPRLSGEIRDADTREPLAGCRVGEAFTDDQGRYALSERRYCEWTWPGLEAPLLLVREAVAKAGYRTTWIEAEGGGGAAEGAHWELEPISLRRE